MNFYAVIIRDKMINRCTSPNDAKIRDKYKSIFKIAQGSIAKRVLNSLLYYDRIILL